MSALTRDDVAHLAGLARIDLSDAELDRMVGELGVILESVAKVQEVAAGGHRADVAPDAADQRHPARRGATSLGVEDVLAAAPAQEQQRFSVPRILDRGLTAPPCRLQTCPTRSEPL